MKTITLLIILLLYPLKMPQGEEIKDTTNLGWSPESRRCISPHLKSLTGAGGTAPTADGSNWAIPDTIKFWDGWDKEAFKATSNNYAAMMMITKYTELIARLDSCSQVFRIEKKAHLDSIYVKRPPYPHNLTRVLFPGDTVPEYHCEHVVRYSYDSVLVRDTTVYLGE